jgi:hypothetical protein
VTQRDLINRVLGRMRTIYLLIVSLKTNGDIHALLLGEARASRR